MPEMGRLDAQMHWMNRRDANVMVVAWTDF